MGKPRRKVAMMLYNKDQLSFLPPNFVELILDKFMVSVARTAINELHIDELSSATILKKLRALGKIYTDSDTVTVVYNVN